MIFDSNDATNLTHKILLMDKQYLRLRKTFTNNSSANIKLLNSQIRIIYLQTSSNVTKNWITANEKCN